MSAAHWVEEGQADMGSIPMRVQLVKCIVASPMLLSENEYLRVHTRTSPSRNRKTRSGRTDESST